MRRLLLLSAAAILFLTAQDPGCAQEQGLAAKQWISIANSDMTTGGPTLAAIAMQTPCESAGGYWTGSACQLYNPPIDDQWQIRLGKWINAWSNIQADWGGAVCTNNRLYLFGGGHNDSPHNGIMAIDPSTGDWERVTQPSGYIWNQDPEATLAEMLSAWGCSDTAADGTGICGAQVDGQPTARHTYYTIASDGSYLYVASGGAVFPGASGGPEPTSWRLNLSTKTWSQISPIPTTASTGHMEVVGSTIYASVGGWETYDIGTDTWTQITTGVATVPGGLVSHVYVPTTDEFIFFGNNVSKKMPRAQWGKSATYAAIASPPAIVSERYLGATYYPPEDLVLYWDGGQTITTLDPHTYAWGEITLGGEDPGAALANGTFFRFSYCDGRLVLVNGVDADMFYAGNP